jgi:hypothetical protein
LLFGTQIFPEGHPVVALFVTWHESLGYAQNKTSRSEQTPFVAANPYSQLPPACKLQSASVRQPPYTHVALYSPNAPDGTHVATVAPAGVWATQSASVRHWS